MARDERRRGERRKEKEKKVFLSFSLSAEQKKIDFIFLAVFSPVPPLPSFHFPIFPRL